MEEVTFKLDDRKRGAFRIEEDGKSLGEMVVGVSDTTLTVYHTEVAQEMEGKGLAKKMFDEMVVYARENKLQVLPLCAYVLAQFKRSTLR